MFVSPEVINIELGKLEKDLYRIIAIHNFHAEDCNPRLNECLTGVFLARKINNRWEEAEDHPIECRAIERLGSVDTRLKRVLNL